MSVNLLVLLAALLPSVQPFVAGPAPALGPARHARAAQPPRCHHLPRQILEVWWDSSWPLPLPSSHGYATSRAIPQRTEFPCADPNEKMMCQCCHVAVAHSLFSHARLRLLSHVLSFTAWPRDCVAQASTMFILFFCRFTLRGECTIVVECVKCLRGECLLLLYFFETPQFRCPVLSVLAFYYILFVPRPPPRSA